MKRFALILTAGIAALGLASAGVATDAPLKADFVIPRDQTAEQIYAGFVATAEDACEYELIDGRDLFAVSRLVLATCVLDLLDQAIAAVGREDLAELHRAAVAASPWPQLRR